MVRRDIRQEQHDRVIEADFRSREVMVQCRIPTQIPAVLMSISGRHALCLKRRPYLMVITVTSSLLPRCLVARWSGGQHHAEVTISKIGASSTRPTAIGAALRTVGKWPWLLRPLVSNGGAVPSSNSCTLAMMRPLEISVTGFGGVAVRIASVANRRVSVS